MLTLRVDRRSLRGGIASNRRALAHERRDDGSMPWTARAEIVREGRVWPDEDPDHRDELFSRLFDYAV